MKIEFRPIGHRPLLRWLILAALCGWFATSSIAMADDAQADDPQDESNPALETEAEEQEAADEQGSEAEIAAELANPNSVLGFLAFNFDYINYGGDLPDANDQSAVRMTFQPVLPYPVGEGVNLFFRPAIPVVFKQDVPTANGYENPGVNLGDTGFDIALGKTTSNGYVLLGGMVGTVPTATDKALGRDQWALGPEIGGAIVRDWGVLGLLLTHQWDVAGSDDVDTNVTGGQYFYTLNLKDGWQIQGTPTFSYNHEAPSGERWTLPIAFGFNKVANLGGRPWKFGFQYWHYVKSPDTFGPDWQIRLIINPVVELPWKKH